VLYVLVDPISPAEIRYVGTAVDPDRRFRNHRWSVNRSKFPLYGWWRELRECGRYPKMIVIGFGGCEEERVAIARLREAGVALLNVPGGSGIGHLGRKHTPETRAKMSASCRGKNVGNRWNVGKKIPEGQRAKIGASLRGRILSEERRSKLRKPKSLQARANMGVAQRGKILPPDVRAKISASLRGNKNRLGGLSPARPEDLL